MELQRYSPSERTGIGMNKRHSLRVEEIRLGASGLLSLLWALPLSALELIWSVGLWWLEW